MSVIALLLKKNPVNLTILSTRLAKMIFVNLFLLLLIGLTVLLILFMGLIILF